MNVPILLVHGFQSHWNKNWYPWVREKLKEHVISVVCPDLPEPWQPNISAHMDVLRKHCEVLGHNPILIGHSLGAATVLRFTEYAQIQPSRVILVGPVAKDIPSIANEEYPDEFFSYRDSPYDTEYLQKAIPEVILFLSHDDPYIDFDPTLAYYRQLFGDKLTLREYANAGHFNTPAGYREFPDILPYLLQ